MIRVFVDIIIEKLWSAGFQAYLVGGCVRDSKLNIVPQDYDISTNAKPNQVMELFPGSKLIGESFGVVLMPVGIQVATFRKDVGIGDGRHPESVEYSDTLEEDAERRDFTINAMYMLPRTRVVYDPFGGMKDLAMRQIRFVGDPQKRIEEDYLRMLRAVRFALRFDFTIEWDSWLAIQKNADKILSISAERIFQELTKIFMHKSRGKSLQLLKESNLLKYVLPDVMRMYGVQQPKHFHPEGCVFTHTVKAMNNLPDEISKELAWAVVLHDVGKPGTQFFDPETGVPKFYGHDVLGGKMVIHILQDLKVDNNTISKVSEMVTNHMRFRNVEKMKKSTLINFIRRPLFPEEMKLHWADCMGSSGKVDHFHFINKFMEETEQKTLSTPRARGLFTGNDLRDMKYTPGPIYAEILEKVREEILEGRIDTTEGAKMWVEKNYERK
jgi:poly(A) polymerase